MKTMKILKLVSSSGYLLLFVPDTLFSTFFLLLLLSSLVSNRFKDDYHNGNYRFVGSV